MTPIKDDALIGNCETAALIGPRGDIDWLCLPTREALERGPLIYRGDEKPGKEGAFLIGSFWWINHLIREGQIKGAEEMLFKSRQSKWRGDL